MIGGQSASVDAGPACFQGHGRSADASKGRSSTPWACHAPHVHLGRVVDDWHLCEVRRRTRHTEQQVPDRLRVSRAKQLHTLAAAPADAPPPHAQAQHDYLSGNYPVVREDAAQMCALQMQAEAGPTMLETLELLEGAIERFVTKQARGGPGRVRGRLPRLPPGTRLWTRRHRSIGLSKEGRALLMQHCRSVMHAQLQSD